MTNNMTPVVHSKVTEHNTESHSFYEKIILINFRRVSERVFNSLKEMNKRQIKEK